MSYTLLTQDCLTLDTKSVSGAKLVYVDPPFGPKGEDKYFGVGDSENEYLDYVLSRVSHVVEGLSNYNLVVHVDPKYSHYLKVLLDKRLGRRNFRNEIVWCYSGPSIAKRHLPRKHDVLLWYGMGDYPYNPTYVPYVEGLAVGGRRAWSGEKDVSSYINRGKHIEDWWTDIPALVRNESEKRGYPTQKPQALLDRIVLAFSNPRDLVVDPMMGSGTSLMSCLNHQRNYLGVDLNPESVRLAEEWVQDHLGLMSWY